MKMVFEINFLWLQEMQGRGGTILCWAVKFMDTQTRLTLTSVSSLFMKRKIVSPSLDKDLFSFQSNLISVLIQFGYQLIKTLNFYFLHQRSWTHRYNRIFASSIYLPWLSGGFPGWVEVIRGGGRRMIRWGVHLWRGIPCPQWNGCWVQVSPSQLILVTYHPHTINIVPDNEIIF